jgi:UDP-GlcNAc:undecaprenyl-phosphate GlcNAc-1-phosphate transferase
LAIDADYTATNRLGWLSALAIFAVPLFEIVFVSYLRFRRGASILVGSRDHFSLRLRKWRLSVSQTVLSSCSAAAVSSVAGLFALGVSPAASLVVYACLAVFFLSVAVWLKAVDMGL